MPAKTKERHTKEQVLRLLDHAIEREDVLTAKVAALESALSEWRQKAENPRHELDDKALLSSKISFRIDYYRLGDEVASKGIVEELSSRETQTFEGGGFREIEQFVRRFLPKTIESPVSKPQSRAKKNKNPEVQKAGNSLPAAVPASPLRGRVEMLQTAESLDPNVSALQVGIRPEGLHELWGKRCVLNLSVEALEGVHKERYLHQEPCQPSGEMLVTPPQPWVLKRPGLYRVRITLARNGAEKRHFFEEVRVFALS